jgi:hypothetical protein
MGEAICHGDSQQTVLNGYGLHLQLIGWIHSLHPYARLAFCLVDTREILLRAKTVGV